MPSVSDTLFSRVYVFCPQTHQEEQRGATQRTGKKKHETKTDFAMAAFSFTAPRFTDEMKEAERKAMTEEERERIEAEMYGLATSAEEAKEETPEMVAEFLESFQSHLDSIEYKPTYLEAIEKCPQILETESAPIRFLRAESFDAEVSVHFFGRRGCSCKCVLTPL